MAAIRRLLAPLALLLLVWAAPAAAQRIHEYDATCSGSLSGAGTTCTIQIPASATRWVLLKKVFVQTSVAATVSQDRDGGAATGSGVSIRRKNPNGSWVATPVATVYQAANTGAGTAVGPPALALSASPSFLTMDLDGVVLEKSAGAAQNYSVRLGTMTGSYTITIAWEERTNY